MIFSKENKIKRELKHRVWWLKIREAGKKKYILRYGILYYALPIGLMLFFYEHWGTPISNLLPRILISLIVWPTVGFLYGLYTWKVNEKLFLKFDQNIMEREKEKEDIS